MKGLKIFAIVLVIILLVNMVLFAMKLIPGMIFWGIIIVGGLVAFFVMPKLRNEK